MNEQQQKNRQRVWGQRIIKFLLIALLVNGSWTTFRININTILPSATAHPDVAIVLGAAV